ECDVVEEVLRIYGYNNIELPLNMKVAINRTPTPDPEALRSRISEFLANNGFVETMNNSLTKSDYYSKLRTYPPERLVRLLNPLSHDLDSMRQTLILNALEVVAYNLNRQITDLKIFEMGNVYSFVPKEGDDDPASNLKSYREEMRLSMVITGHGAKSWRNETGLGHYFYLKGYLELLLKRLGCNIYDLESDAAPSDIFSEGLEYSLQGKQIAVLGTIQPALARRYGIKQPVFVAEIMWDGILELLKRNKVRFKELPKYPEVRRDLALLLDESVSFAELRKCAFQTEKSLLRQVILFDVYRGDKIPSDKKQYALGFTLQHPDQTLTDADVEKAVDKLLKAFQTKFGAILR
ncbi:MAG TPA: phenylalanine--tRNA ligase subunit beta, partial [Bacteroidales bacterium]|nr:phenylalanine--tRNA ligase subunit beta [Bacteroidales bacterium]